MPCFDKKLEASRSEFRTDGVQDVDTVLSTGEVLQVLEQLGDAQLRGPPADSLDRIFGEQADALYRHAGSGSGGYLHHVLQYAAKELFGAEGVDVRLVAGRNKDIQECCVEFAGGGRLRFASAYGFRNIQTIVRKIKSRTCPYDFVEIMACPSGCLNGGGQIRAADGTNPLALLAAVEREYARLPVRALGDSATLPLFASWKSTQAGAGDAEQLAKRSCSAPSIDAADRALLHTTYRRIEASDSLLSSSMKW